ncbi:MAG: hypothetical protein ABMA14_08800 [Hyphomonadaceae bacterium]
MKITYAKNSLGEALAAAPAQMAHTALVRAEDMLAQISNDCIERIDVLLAEFPRNVGNDVAEITRHIYEAYETGRKMIGIGTIAGMPEMDTVATSLCDVADGLMIRGLTDWEPLRVHVAVMDLMRRADLPPAGKQQLIASLGSVRQRFASPPAADSVGALASAS